MLFTRCITLLRSDERVECKRGIVAVGGRDHAECSRDTGLPSLMINPRQIHGLTRWRYGPVGA